jgi:hypothetical protein
MRYVFEPERHASADEIAMMLRCDDALTPNVTSRLLWRCKDSSWCRSSKGVGGGCSLDTRPFALKMIRRGGGQSGSRYVDLTELEREMDLSNARVVALYRDPRAVITSQINHVHWHDGQQDGSDEESVGDNGFATLANDVCWAHKQRIVRTKERGGAVVSYADLVRSPLPTMASLYSSLGLGVLPNEVVRFVRRREEEEGNTTAAPLDDRARCRNETLKRTDPDAWSEACYSVRHTGYRLGSGRLESWRREVTPHQVRRMEEAKECVDVFRPTTKGEEDQDEESAWPTFPKATDLIVRVFLSRDPRRFDRRASIRRQRQLNEVLVFLMPRPRGAHASSVLRAVAEERLRHRLDNEVMVVEGLEEGLEEGEEGNEWVVVEALGRALSSVAARYGSDRPTHVWITDDGEALLPDDRPPPTLCSPTCTNVAGGEDWRAALVTLQGGGRGYVGLRHPTVRGLLLSPNVRQHRSVLLLGDSLSRHVVEAQASDVGCVLKDWSTFRYKRGVSASLTCTTEETTLGFLHLYGNRPRGPYLHGHVDDEEDPFTSTPQRVCRGLRSWEEAHGGVPPSEVVWSVVWWDMSFVGMCFCLSLTCY